MAAITRDEEVALARRARAGDSDAEGKLVEAHLPWVRHLAKGLSGRGLSRDDLVQVGSIGLLKAVRRFDPDQGIRLTTWSHKFIRRAMAKAVRKESRSRLEFMPPDRMASLQERPAPSDYGPRSRALELACEQLLNPSEKEVFTLRHGDLKPLSYRQIAGLIGRSKPAVGRTHRKAIAKLKSSLNPSAA